MTIEATRTKAYLDDRAHVFHSWSAQGTLDPVEIVGGLGSYFWDSSGNRYLDFSSQLVNLNIGHQHPKLIAAIQEKRPNCARSHPHLPMRPEVKRPG